MKRLLSIFIIAIGLCSITLHAQNAGDKPLVNVRGKVIDHATNAAVVNAAVQIVQKGKALQATVSDTLGNFEFSVRRENFTDTIFGIKVMAKGYEEKVVPDMNLKKLTPTMKTIIPIRKEE